MGLARFAVSASTAVTWALAKSHPGSKLSATPVYVGLGIAVLGAATAVAALTSVWRFSHLRSPAEMLDDCIRRGDDASNTIIYDGL